MWINRDLKLNFLTFQDVINQSQIMIDDIRKCQKSSIRDLYWPSQSRQPLPFLQCSCSMVQNQEPKIEIYILSFLILIEISNLIYLFSFCFSRYPACFLCHHQHDVVHPDYFHFHRLSNLFHFQRLCQVLICLQQLSWSPRSQSLVQVGELHLGKANWLHLLWPMKKLNSKQRQLQQVFYTKILPQRATKKNSR